MVRSGKCEFVSARAQAAGLPARNFKNSTFANMESMRAAEKEAYLDLRGVDTGPRGIVDGALVRIFIDRGSIQGHARVNDRSRAGVVTALLVWWHRHTPGGRNANAVTNQSLTDLGRGSTFYDCLVEVECV